MNYCSLGNSKAHGSTDCSKAMILYTGNRSLIMEDVTDRDMMKLFCKAELASLFFILSSQMMYCNDLPTTVSLNDTFKSRFFKKKNPLHFK